MLKTFPSSHYSIPKLDSEGDERYTSCIFSLTHTVHDKCCLNVFVYDFLAQGLISVDSTVWQCCTLIKKKKASCAFKYMWVYVLYEHFLSIMLCSLFLSSWWWRVVIFSVWMPLLVSVINWLSPNLVPLKHCVLSCSLTPTVSPAYSVVQCRVLEKMG